MQALLPSVGVAGETFSSRTKDEMKHGGIVPTVSYQDFSKYKSVNLLSQKPKIVLNLLLFQRTHYLDLSNSRPLSSILANIQLFGDTFVWRWLRSILSARKLSSTFSPISLRHTQKHRSFSTPNTPHRRNDLHPTSLGQPSTVRT